MAAKVKNKKKEIESILSQLVELLGIQVSFIVEKESTPAGEEDSYRVTLDSPNEAGILIGAHGSTLFALQSFLSLALRQRFGDWVHVNVDVGDWKKKQEDHLVDLAKQTAQRAISTGEPQQLYNLTPDQRRVIHMALAEEKNVTTESEGEGRDRYLIIKAK